MPTRAEIRREQREKRFRNHAKMVEDKRRNGYTGRHARLTGPSPRPDSGESVGHGADTPTTQEDKNE